MFYMEDDVFLLCFVVYVIFFFGGDVLVWMLSFFKVQKWKFKFCDFELNEIILVIGVVDKK